MELARTEGSRSALSIAILNLILSIFIYPAIVMRGQLRQGRVAGSFEHLVLLVVDVPLAKVLHKGALVVMRPQVIQVPRLAL